MSASTMVSALFTRATEVSLTAREGLSGAAGSISLACWVFLLVPQLVENYKQSSADGISQLFILVWFVGDICNMIGAIWAGLVPTVIAIAVYFCISDGVLLSQCFYYNIKNSRKWKKPTAAGSGSVDDQDPTQPLLGDRARRSSSTTGRSNSNVGLPGSQRRRSSAAASDAARRRSSLRENEDPLGKIVESADTSAAGRETLKNTVAVVAICVVGAAGWAIAWATGAWKPTPTGADVGGGSDEEMAVGAQILGYLSAVAYLGARIPQIIKNYRERSCEGLSLLFFMLSLLGNLTYGAGILFHSSEREYILTNLPWLIGSLGTMIEDVTIFAQFHMYANKAAIDGEAII